MFKIDKGVPMPPKRTQNKYPWHEMEVGDSFFVIGKVAADMAPPVRLRAQGWRFAMRVDFNDANARGLRVWRIE